jgi:hypothetical protein
MGVLAATLYAVVAAEGMALVEYAIKPGITALYIASGKAAISASVGAT